MASIRKRNGNWSAEVRRRGIYQTATFSEREDAEAWAFSVEQSIIKRKHAKLIQKKFAPFPTDRLMGHSEIVGHSDAYSDTCGVYFLIQAGRVVYVGKSITCHVRIYEHKKNGRQFTHYFILPCTTDQAALLESCYILELCPEQNRGLDGELTISDRRAHKELPALKAPIVRQQTSPSP